MARMSGVSIYALLVLCTWTMSVLELTSGRKVHASLRDGEHDLTEASRAESTWSPCGEGQCLCQGTQADCSHRNLRKIPQLPAGISFLDFSSNSFGNIVSDDFFANVPHLTGLTVTHNGISNISSKAFTLLTNLVMLDLSHNALSCETLRVVFNVPTLEKLILEFATRCAKLEEIGINNPVPRLKELHLGSNPFHSVNVSCLTPFAGLKNLHIDYTFASPLVPPVLTEVHAFHQFTNLTFLDLTRNRLSCHQLAIVFTIPTVQVLLLRETQSCICFNRTGTTYALPRLQEVDLGGSCTFLYFDLVSLSPFTGLARLFLDGTESPRSGPVFTNYHALSELTNLTFLDLSNNRVSCLDLYILLAIPHLKQLIVQHGTTCTSLPRIKNQHQETLDLSHNSLQIVTFDSNILTELKYLDLSDNEIWTFDVRAPAPHLEVINLSRNKLTSFLPTFQEEFVSFLARLKLLNLTGNRLEFTSDQPFVSAGLENLETLDVSAQSNAGVSTVVGINRLTFENPHLKELILDDNYVSFMNDTVVDAESFSGCPNLTRISLVNNDFSGVSEERFQQLLGHLLLLKSMSLRSTGISYVSADMFQGLLSLEFLDLSHNSLYRLPDDAFRSPPGLITINLSFNLITVVQKSTFSVASSRRLQHIDLSANPFQCSCSVLWFQKWLLDDPSLFAGSKSDYMCADIAETSVQSFFIAEQACFLSPETNKVIIATVTLFIGINLLCFLYRCRRCWCLCCVGDSGLSSNQPRFCLRERRFEYDLFVSYDSNDFPWVHDHLMPSLEWRMGLRLCIHQRDFILGHRIVENIMASVESSEKMLMLFSRSFARSEWCQFELSLCMTQAFGSQGVLLIVLLEDIPLRDLTPAMLAVMQTFPCMKWSDDSDAVDFFCRRVF